jgi:hypothetical protein
MNEWLLFTLTVVAFAGTGLAALAALRSARRLRTQATSRDIAATTPETRSVRELPALLDQLTQTSLTGLTPRTRIMLRNAAIRALTELSRRPGVSRRRRVGEPTPRESERVDE